MNLQSLVCLSSEHGTRNEKILVYVLSKWEIDFIFIFWENPKSHKFWSNKNYLYDYTYDIKWCFKDYKFRMLLMSVLDNLRIKTVSTMIV